MYTMIIPVINIMIVQGCTLAGPAVSTFKVKDILTCNYKANQQWTNAASRARQQQRQVWKNKSSYVSQKMKMKRWNFSSSSKHVEKKKKRLNNCDPRQIWDFHIIVKRASSSSILMFWLRLSCSSEAETRTEDEETFVEKLSVLRVSF